ncbi:MAG: hypothetical protein KAV87_00285 [Desulfobacteraceae bacterium]|nr:hypothetical protein [Desulfobacteraceae bacterium]
MSEKKICKLDNTECTGTPCMYSAADKPENCKQLYLAMDEAKAPRPQDSSGSAEFNCSMPKIGATVVCKTSRNEHRMLITTEEQVAMIADLLLENPKGWAIEA